MFVHHFDSQVQEAQKKCQVRVIQLYDPYEKVRTERTRVFCHVATSFYSKSGTSPITMNTDD